MVVHAVIASNTYSPAGNADTLGCNLDDTQSTCPATLHACTLTQCVPMHVGTLLYTYQVAAPKA